MRSLLFVPADSPRKLDKAFSSGADALIVDLEDSVAAASKGEARRGALAFLRERRAGADRPRLYVRVNGFDSGLNEGDLDAVMTAAPDGIVLPKAGGGADLTLLDSRLAVREALHGVPDGNTRILAIATETAAAMFELRQLCRRQPAAWRGLHGAARIFRPTSVRSPRGPTESGRSPSAWLAICACSPRPPPA